MFSKIFAISKGRVFLKHQDAIGMMFTGCRIFLIKILEQQVLSQLIKIAGGLFSEIDKGNLKLMREFIIKFVPMLKIYPPKTVNFDSNQLFIKQYGCCKQL
eukprot:TRINITY_DN4259_c0_g1_i1.p3 TRINITY_DN4259_c0_g1~~TRINITY_DN4259_c0_g1_i1.p3  ORF type:complete len:117 (-),score=0.93 TRINITY_DN4259_c0_g1_i1:373-675(-)